MDPLSYIRRAQNVSLLGFGDNESVYDLGVMYSGRIAEIKQALYDLSEKKADKLNYPDSYIKETVWQKILLGPEDNESWGYAAADEFCLTMGRYKSLLNKFDGAVVQHGDLAGSGDPQPTIVGMEVLVFAVDLMLGDVEERLPQYMSWRPSIPKPISPLYNQNDVISLSVKPTNNIVPLAIMQKLGDPSSWTEDDLQQWVPPSFAGDLSVQEEQELAELDQGLLESWQLATMSTNEDQLEQAADAIKASRILRNQFIWDRYIETPEAQCFAQGMDIDLDTGQCKEPISFLPDDSTPSVSLDAKPVSAIGKTGAIIITGTAIGTILWGISKFKGIVK